MELTNDLRLSIIFNDNYSILCIMHIIPNIAIKLIELMREKTGLSVPIE